MIIVLLDFNFVTGNIKFVKRIYFDANSITLLFFIIPKNKSKFSLDDINKSKQILEKRMNGLGEGACSKFLEQYANPIMQKIKLNKS